MKWLGGGTERTVMVQNGDLGELVGLRAAPLGLRPNGGFVMGSPSRRIAGAAQTDCHGCPHPPSLATEQTEAKKGRCRYTGQT